MKRRCWKNCVREFVYCRPGLNRRLLCIRESMLEVARILNSGGCKKGNSSAAPFGKPH